MHEFGFFVLFTHPLILIPTMSILLFLSLMIIIFQFCTYYVKVSFVVVSSLLLFCILIFFLILYCLGMKICKSNIPKNIETLVLSTSSNKPLHIDILNLEKSNYGFISMSSAPGKKSKKEYRNLKDDLKTLKNNKIDVLVSLLELWELDRSTTISNENENENSNNNNNSDAELLSLTYYEIDPGLVALVAKEEELKLKEKSSRDFNAIRKEREGIREEITARKKRNKKGEMILRKGATAFQIPDKGHGVKFNGSKSSSLLSSGRHRTAFAFEIHVHDASTVKVLTICCDTHKDRRSFIRTIQNALVTRDEVNRMRDQFLTPDAVRDLHSRLGQQRRDFLTHKIVDSFPAPFQTRGGSMSFAHMSSASMSLHQSTANLSIVDNHTSGTQATEEGGEGSGDGVDGMGNSATLVAEEEKNDRAKCIIS
mmetsp:Transcript_15133/g.17997  ORF Transcript_15133/g.17997 Transcript_15133/m.17997 type:complete len:425 (-) Transcript_15133:127-1401(-)